MSLTSFLPLIQPWMTNRWRTEQEYSSLERKNNLNVPFVDEYLFTLFTLTLFSALAIIQCTKEHLTMSKNFTNLQEGKHRFVKEFGNVTIEQNNSSKCIPGTQWLPNHGFFFTSYAVPSKYLCYVLLSRTPYIQPEIRHLFPWHLQLFYLSIPCLINSYYSSQHSQPRMTFENSPNAHQST